MKLSADLLAKAFTNLSVSNEDNDLVVNINAEHKGEEGAEEEVVAADVDNVPLDTSETPEAAELDAADAGAEMAEETDKLEQLDDTVESLEAILVTMATISQEGLEITGATARLLRATVDNAVSRIENLTSDGLGIPSCEDFDLSPMTSWETSMEAVGGAMLAGIRAAGNTMKELLKHFLEFIKRIFDAAEQARHKADLLDVEAGKAKSTTGEIKVPGILTYGGNIEGGLKTLTEVVSAMVSTKYADLQVILKTKDLGTTHEEIENTFNRVNASVVAFKNDQLAGGFSIQTGESGFPVVKSTDGREAKTVPALTPQQCKAVIAANKKLIEQIIAYKKSGDARKLVTEIFINKLAVQNGSESAIGLKSAAIYHRASKAWNKRIAFENQVIGKALSVANAANNVVAASLKGKAKDAE